MKIIKKFVVFLRLQMEKFFQCSYWRNWNESGDDLQVSPVVHPFARQQMIKIVPTQSVLCKEAGGRKHKIEVIGSKGATSPYKVIGNVSNSTARIRPFGHAGAGAIPVLCHLKFQREVEQFNALTN